MVKRLGMFIWKTEAGAQAREALTTGAALSRISSAVGKLASASFVETVPIK
jgi:hypothetical protein